MIRLLANRPGDEVSASAPDVRQTADAFAAELGDCPRLGGPRPIADALAVVLARYERRLASENSQPALNLAVPVLPHGGEPCWV